MRNTNYLLDLVYREFREAEFRDYRLIAKKPMRSQHHTTIDFRKAIPSMRAESPRPPPIQHRLFQLAETACGPSPGTAPPGLMMAGQDEQGGAQDAEDQTAGREIRR